EQDRIVTAQLFEDRVGKGLAGLVPAAGAEVVSRRLYLGVGTGQGSTEHPETFGPHLRSDAVACDHCKIDAASHACHRTSSVRTATCASQRMDTAGPAFAPTGPAPPLLARAPSPV